MKAHHTGKAAGLHRTVIKLALVAATTLSPIAFAQTVALAQASTSTGGNAEAGRQVFNQYCYHCHGTDAVQGERPRDLRRLTKRYGEERQTVFLKTVTEGRPDKGMPTWAGVITKETFADIWAFLETVQAQ